MPLFSGVTQPSLVLSIRRVCVTCGAQAPCHPQFVSLIGSLDACAPGSHGAKASCSPMEIAAMARKPNYNFERAERDRLKALKTAEKAAAKKAQRDADRAAGNPPGDDDQDDDDQ